MLRKWNAFIVLPILVIFYPSNVCAESIECPSIMYYLVEEKGVYQSGEVRYDDRSSLVYGNIDCFYEKNVEISYGWVQSYAKDEDRQRHCKIKLSPKGEIYTDIKKKNREIVLYSSTHLAHMVIKLTRKQFSKKNRQYWIDLGTRLIKESERRGLACDEADGTPDRYPVAPSPFAEQATMNQTPSGNSSAKEPLNVKPESTGGNGQDYDKKISDIINKMKKNTQ